MGVHYLAGSGVTVGPEVQVSGGSMQLLVALLRVALL